jgi:hypothetical protein
MLGAKGLSNGHARNFLSLMRQTYGDELVLEVLAEAQKQDISKPVPWIKKALETRQKPRGNKQESLEEKNRRAVEDWAPPEDARSSDAAR